VTPSGPSLVETLDAFYQEHQLCDDLDGGVDDIPEGASYVWFDCLTCDARIAKRL
jgi:hypothetical protein